MLNDHDGVPVLRKTLQNIDKLVDIRKMKACCRLIKNIDRLARGSLRELSCELYSLRLAAGELRGWLPETYVGKTHIVQCLDLSPDSRNIFKKCQSLLHGHIQDVIDTLALIVDIQCLAVIALAVADFARNIDIRKKMHLDLPDTVSLAGLAASALHIKGKSSFLITTHLRIDRAREQIADHVKYSGIGGGIRSRRATYR